MKIVLNPTISMTKKIQSRFKHKVTIGHLLSRDLLSRSISEEKPMKDSEKEGWNTT